MFLRSLLLAGAYLCFTAFSYKSSTSHFYGNKPGGRDKPGTKKTNELTVKSTETTKNWQYLVLKDTMTVRLVKYYKAYCYCGLSIVKAMAICVDNKGDSLRILELCPGPKDYHEGDLLDFYPYSHITQNQKTYEKYKISDEYVHQYSFNTINKTTFAKLSKHIPL